MNQLSVSELKSWRDEGKEHRLIDVRESHEIEICTLQGESIPMGEIMNRHSDIPKDVPVVIHCRSGQRSSAVVNALMNNFGFQNLYNLDGGILAWATEIDTTLETY